MTLPASFKRDGFLPASSLHTKFRRLMIGSDGWSNTGKTEFALSAPGPGINLILDRGIDGVLDNQNPPATRNPDFAYSVIKVPPNTSTNQRTYADYWKAFRDTFYKALANEDCRTIIIDGDNDSWELQRLAAFGKLTQVPPLFYVECNAARRAMIAKAWDSGKIVIATNKLKEEYALVKGTDKREKTGGEERQGFTDQDYLWQIQLRHLYLDGKFGVRIMKCKSDTGLQGIELWGDDCNFQGLVQTVYPNIPLSEWGY